MVEKESIGRRDFVNHFVTAFVGFGAGMFANDYLSSLEEKPLTEAEILDYFGRTLNPARYYPFAELTAAPQFLPGSESLPQLTSSFGYPVPINISWAQKKKRQQLQKDFPYVENELVNYHAPDQPRPLPIINVYMYSPFMDNYCDYRARYPQRITLPAHTKKVEVIEFQTKEEIIKGIVKINWLSITRQLSEPIGTILTPIEYAAFFEKSGIDEMKSYQPPFGTLFIPLDFNVVEEYKVSPPKEDQPLPTPSSPTTKSPTRKSSPS